MTLTEKQRSVNAVLERLNIVAKFPSNYRNHDSKASFSLSIAFVDKFEWAIVYHYAKNGGYKSKPSSWPTANCDYGRVLPDLLTGGGCLYLGPESLELLIKRITDDLTDGEYLYDRHSPNKRKNIAEIPPKEKESAEIVNHSKFWIWTGVVSLIGSAITIWVFLSGKFTLKDTASCLFRFFP